MNARLVAPLLGTASLLALGYSAPVQAQQGAQSTASSSSGLEEIVVTARRREERAQTVPITMTVLSQEQVETQQIHNVNDLARDVPGFTICCGTGGEAGFLWIRGITGVLAYFDQAPVDLYGSSMYFDQASNEVLKGPQGTLFGIATNGGAIVFESKQPTNAFEGYAQAEFGNYGHYQFQGVVNVPIIADKLLVRVGGEVTKTDGYIHDIGDNKDLANEDYYIFRASVTARPSDDLQDTLVVNYSHADSNFAGDEFIPYEVNPGATFAQIPLPIIGNVPLTLGNGPALAALENPATATSTFLQLLATKTAGGQPSLSFFPNIAALYAQQRRLGWYSIIGTSIPGGPFSHDERWNIVNTASWDLNDDFTVKDVASYQEINLDQRSSTNLLPIPLLAQTQPTGPLGPEVQYTNDLQILGKLFNDKLSFTLGQFTLLSWPQVTFAQGAYFPGRGPHNIQYNCTLGTCTGETQVSHRNTLAVYGQGTYDLSDLLPGLSATAGYRWTWDRVYQSDANYTSTGVLTGQTSAHALFHAPSMYFNLEYKLASNSQVYASYSKGFSTGGFNAGNVAPFPKEYQPETLESYEIGVKSDFDFGIVNLESVKARTNLSAYYGYYNNIKQNITALTPTGLAVVTLNVASAYTEGVDGEFTIRPVEDLELSANFAYNHVAFTQFINPTTTPPSNEAGAPQSYNPYWDYNLSGTYHFPMNHAYGDISFSATYSWIGKRSNTIILPQLPQNVDPAFDNLDMSVNWKDVWGYQGVTLRGWATNLLENHWAMGSLAAYQALGILDYSVAKPLMFGFTARYEFGG